VKWGGSTKKEKENRILVEKRRSKQKKGKTGVSLTAERSNFIREKKAEKKCYPLEW